MARARRIGILTSGGLAPCLSSAVASLTERWAAMEPSAVLVGYRDGYAGLLRGDSVVFDAVIRAHIDRAHALGGSPLGNSRVKLSNAADCARRGLVAEGADPLEVAAAQLRADGIDVLHPVGGDDTATTAADLAAHLAAEGHDLQVLALPKTIDNDIVPIARSMGSATAAEYGSRFAQNIIAEHSASPRSIVVHEVMGRNCGWLTAATAQRYQTWVRGGVAIPGLVDEVEWSLHAVLLPEIEFTIDELVARLRPVMERVGNVNVFVAEGAGAQAVIDERLAAGVEIARDAFGHPRLDDVNVGEWLADHLGAALGAEKTLVAKSGYFARSAPANAEDRALVAECADEAVRAAIDGRVGLVGHDEEADDRLGVVAFDRVRGGKRLDVTAPWVRALLDDVASSS